jgi:GAF domain-containing protein
VRGQVIGVVDARKPEDGGEWTAEQTTLLETMTEQLGVALESARLYQDARRRAARERLTGEVTARMRETLDLEAVLTTATREISEALDLAALDVRLGTQAELTGE